MTGAELVEQLRAADVVVPTVLITAASSVQDLARALGLRCYLGKPFGSDDLVTVVRQALDGPC